jgi:hypothetical protein
VESFDRTQDRLFERLKHLELLERWEHLERLDPQWTASCLGSSIVREPLSAARLLISEAGIEGRRFSSVPFASIGALAILHHTAAL